MDTRLASLRRILRIHINWLTVKLLGKDLVSKEELDELKDYGRLTTGDEVGLIESSFVLGRISALSKKSEYKDLTLEKLSRLKKRKFSSIEKLAIREAKLHAARRLQVLAGDAEAAASARINQATADLLADATAKDILQEELAIAIAEKKTRKQLANSVGNKLGADLSAGFYKLMVTEMHRAKQRGVAMAIANKVDIYEKSEGAASSVSVVPNKGACEDCRALYLTETGNPKVFKLSELVGKGSNSDEGVSHVRGRGGIHVGWNPVLPPAHPNCYCELVYVPPGMGWENGRLAVTDEFRYKDHISKAVDKGTMSATITPPGPKKHQGNEPPKVGNIKGVSDPGREGRPPGSQTATQPAAIPAAPFQGSQGPTQSSASDIVYEYWGSRGGQPPPDKGWERSLETGAWRKPVGAGSDGGQEEEAGQLQPTPEEHLANLMAIEDYTHDDKTDQVALDHVENGVIISEKNIGDVKGAKKGVTKGTKKAGIEDNGSSCNKPGREDLDGQDVQNEKTAWRNFTLFGSKLCPVTGSRVIKGKLNSAQAWCENHSPAALVARAISADELITTVKEQSPNWEKVRGQFEEMTVMDIVICNTDRHLENFLLTDEMDDLRAIDHGFSFGKGLSSLYVEIFEGFNSKNMHMRLAEDLNTRFSNTSFGDMKRAYGSETLEWKTAQSYMRMKYIQHVASENEGRLPLEEFSGATADHELTANQKFEKHVHDFIDTHIDDPSSPEYTTANHFAREGILMPSSKLASDSDTRNRGDQFRYEMESRRKIAEIEQIRRGEKSFMADANAYYKDVSKEQQAKLKAAQEPVQERSTALNSDLDDARQAARFAYAALPSVQAQAQGNIEDLPALLDAERVAEKHYQDIRAKKLLLNEELQEIWNNYQQEDYAAKDQIYGNLTPPGQEKAFDRLRSQLDNARLPVRQRKPAEKLPAAAVEQSAAVGIERRKREAAVVEQQNRAKLKKKGG